MTRENILQSLYFLITSLIVIGPALYNRYPLVYFDSGAYMEMAVSLEPSFHRAIGYPMLMRISGWIISNWPIVLIQGFLVSWLSFRLIKIFRKNQIYATHFLTITILSFSTSLSWYAAQLMPDIFTYILSLAVALVVFEPHFTWKKALLYGGVIFSSLITHLSHLPLLLLVIATLFFGKWVWASSKLSKARWLGLTLPLILAFLFTSSYNAIWNNGFRMSLASNIFITANIGEMGLLKMYLNENCESNQFSLCAIKDSLPLETGGYLWDVDGPVQTSQGGWAAMNDECAPIVKDFLTNPRYLKWFLFGAIKATFKQMFQIELGSGLQYQYGDGSPPSWPMHTHFKQELNEYLISVQNKGNGLPLDFFRILNYISLFLTMLVLGWAVLTGRLDQRLILLMVLFLIFYFYNAAITGVLANVYERLQCRLLPLFPFVALLVLSSVEELSQGKSKVTRRE